jgi:hypothetical protein
MIERISAVSNRLRAWSSGRRQKSRPFLEERRKILHPTNFIIDLEKSNPGGL